MNAWKALSSACIAAVLATGCDATTRHRILTHFFDGVPPLQEAGQAPGASRAPGGGAAPAAKVREHGPYAAKLCDACHDPLATNALVVPRDQLCGRCHEIRLDKKYVHGPLASGGCLVCHDPHSSPNSHLLVSESGGFCFHCHDRDSVARIGGHEDLEGGCTDCHDAHQSDTKYLLK
jgi:predicted CXXCH cytochrome family protein